MRNASSICFAEAKSKYEEVCEAMGGHADEALLKKAKAAIDRTLVSEAEGLLVHHLKKTTKKTELHRAISALKSKLEGLGGFSAIHPVLAARCHKALEFE
jgi:hypothetical protein